MIKELKIYLNDWNKTYNERAKLQHVYLVSIVVITLVAGLASLLNPTLGQNLLFCAGVALLTYLVNAVVWALLKSFVLDRLQTIRRKRKA